MRHLGQKHILLPSGLQEEDEVEAEGSRDVKEGRRNPVLHVQPSGEKIPEEYHYVPGTRLEEKGWNRRQLQQERTRSHLQARTGGLTSPEEGD